MKEFLVDDAQKRCPNCSSALPERSKYCYECGQKFTTGRIKLRTLLVELLEEVFNIESRFFRTIGAIFIPGKLTNEYFKGRHKSYASPLRLFLVTAIVHFAAMAYFLGNIFEEPMLKQKNQQLEEAYRIAVIHQIDTLEPGLVAYYEENEKVRSAIDSLQRVLKGNTSDSTVMWISLFQSQSQGDSKMRVSREDLYRLSTEELVDLYEIKGFWDRLFFSQSVRLNTDLANVPAFFIRNLTWMALLMMPALAFILKLLYIRRDRYYVEHLIFSFHYHAFSFLLVSVGFLLQPFWSGAIPLAFFAALIYLFIAMLKVYRQGFIKTFFKYIILNNMYLFIFSIFITVTLLISALLY